MTRPESIPTYGPDATGRTIYPVMLPPEEARLSGRAGRTMCWVISDRSGWIPGSYASPSAARYAFRLDPALLRELAAWKRGAGDLEEHELVCAELGWETALRGSS